MLIFLAALTLQAQILQAAAIPPVGSPATFDVATWNVEWFGSEKRGPGDEAVQLENVRRVIAESDIDLWAVQEIDDEAHFEALVGALGPDYEGALGGASTNLKVGFIYRVDVVDPIAVADSWLLPFRGDFAGRPPLLVWAEVVLPDTTVEVYVVTLHMKCCGDAASYEQRSAAADALKNRVDALHANDPFVILGDFNDELTGSIAGSNPSPYRTFLDDGDAYRFTSLPLDEMGSPTWCGNLACTSGSSLDHILITDELFEHYVEGSTHRFDELLDALDGFVDNTSDHLPVFASFSFATKTGVEAPDVATFGIESIHPNPARGRAVVTYSVDAPAAVRLELIDSLGRVILELVDALQPAGAHRGEMDVTALPAGVYFVRLSTWDSREARPIIIVH